MYSAHDRLFDRLPASVQNVGEDVLRVILSGPARQAIQPGERWYAGRAEFIAPSWVIMAQFIKESRVHAAPSVVFSFHESPGALERLTPPWENVRVVEGGGSLRPGTRVVLSIKVGPLPMQWVAEHTEYVAGEMFADRQVRGPFRSWYHRHFFQNDGRGGTLMRDVVDYEPPLGVIGRFFGSGIVEAKLAKMFDFRHRRVREIVESGDFSGTSFP